MPDLDAFLERPARRFKDEITSPNEQRELDAIILAIRADPYPDNLTKFEFPLPPANPTLYTDGRFYAIYAFENPWTLSVWDMGYDDERSILVPKPPEDR